MSTSIRISGNKAIERACRELPARLAKKVIRQGLRAGAKVVQSDAQVHAPVDTGRTARAIKVRAGKSRKKNVITMAVIIGKGDYQGGTFYGAFVNFGHKTGKRGSANRREIPGKHFMDNALHDKAEQAQTAATTVINAGIEREASSLNTGGR